MELKTCGKCGAKWIGGQLYWSTGPKGKEEDLAGLVCNDFGNAECVNPCRGSELGTTWAKRLEAVKNFESEG